MTFFTILGIVVCVLVVLMILAGFYVVWKIKRTLLSLKEQLGDMPMAMAVPARVHLQRREKLQWNDEEAANRHLQPLWRLGFQDVGSFEIAEMPDVKLRGLARPEESLWAVVYEHPQAGVWMDFVTRYTDGQSTIGSLTTSNARQGEELEHQPAHDKIYAPNLSVEELYQRHLAARRSDMEWQSTVPENYPAEFEKAYASEMDWRHTRGVSEDELRAVAAKSGVEVTDETLQMLRAAQEAQSVAALSEAVRERFLENTAMPAAEWERLRERLVIIHDRMDATAVANEFHAWAFDEDGGAYDEEEDDDNTNDTAPPPYPSHLSARQGFEYLNSTLPPIRRFEQISTVEEPVPADVWRASDTAIN